jgi:hypothetical protein
MSELPKIAVFSGPTATIQNTPALRTTGKVPSLRHQRLGAPAVVYVEAYSAHPMELDSTALYAPPDGYIDDGGEFVATNGSGVPEGRTGVFRVELQPSDLLTLPYVARMGNGDPWTGASVTPGAGWEASRQSFYPEASRLYEEIDTFGLDGEGHSRLLTSRAQFEFVRAAPSAGYRTDDGARLAGYDEVETPGVDFFNYTPVHMQNEPGPEAIVRATNILQRRLSSGEYLGGQWLEGSPTTEESMYWFNLLLDVTVPLVGHSAQRPHGTVSADGDRNIVDGVGYITSRVWEDGEGRDRVGAVMIVDEVIYASREVAKTDARPGNYVATGGHGGIVGSATGNLGAPFLTYVPVRKHTYRSSLRITELPDTVGGVEIDTDGSSRPTVVRIKNGAGELAPDQMPVVRMMKFGRYAQQCCAIDEVRSWFAHTSHRHPLVGIVAEGKSPYGKMDPPAEAVLRVAVFSGMPVVKVGRGNTAGFSSAREPWAIRGNNLTSTKARLLVMACLLKFGALPLAVDPEHPTEEERAATFAAVNRLQEIFDTH